MAHAPGERLRVADGRARVAERTGVLVNPERECGRLDRAHLDLALGEDRDHRRRQGAVVRAHGVLRTYPVELLARVVVEEDDLDLGASRGGLELPEPRGVRRLHDDEALDVGRVDPAGLRHVELLGMQAVEVADVSVQRSGEGNHGIRIEPPCGQHGRKGVEIGVGVADDDLHSRKVRPALRQPPSWGT